MVLRALRDLLGRIGSLLVSIVLRRPGDMLASRLSFLGLGPGCVQQTGMLVLTDIEPGTKDALHETLEKIRTRLMGYQKNHQQISFRNTETVHYAAWMILPGLKSQGGKPPGPDRLAFETNYDGSLVCHLNDLVDNCRRELDEVYSFFPGYPPPDSKGPSVAEFLFNKCQETNANIDASAYYNALPGRSLADINNALAVYYDAKEFVGTPANRTNDAKTIRHALRDHFKSMPKGAPKKPVRFPITHKGIRWLFAINMAVLLLLFPIALLYLARWAVIDVIARYFECKERREKLSDPTLRKPPDYSHLDLGRQNHLCTYTTVLPSSFRMYVMRRTLWLGPVLFNYFFILGRLDQIGTIHFGRWTLIGQQLLFYGNYDGSWSNYLTDFSDEAWGVNLVWGNTIGFPATRFLVGRGARNLEGFQAQAAEHYAPAPVFYSAYRTHYLVDLMRYLEFRDQMLEEMRPRGPVRQWLWDLRSRNSYEHS
jgi:hypothetical protein